MAISVPVTMFQDYVARLQQGQFQLANEGFGYNVKASHHQASYVIYLAAPHVRGDHQLIRNTIARILPEFRVEEARHVTYRNHGSTISELWVFLTPLAG